MGWEEAEPRQEPEPQDLHFPWESEPWSRAHHSTQSCRLFQLLSEEQRAWDREWWHWGSAERDSKPSLLFIDPRTDSLVFFQDHRCILLGWQDLARMWRASFSLCYHEGRGMPARQGGEICAFLCLFLLAAWRNVINSQFCQGQAVAVSWAHVWNPCQSGPVDVFFYPVMHLRWPFLGKRNGQELPSSQDSCSILHFICWLM